MSNGDKPQSGDVTIGTNTPQVVVTQDPLAPSVVIASDQGPPGVRGNSVLNGPANPLNSVGINGDFYINTTTLYMWGPKAAAAWPSTGVPMQGPQGIPGVGIQGPIGPPGNSLLNGAGAPSSAIGNPGDFYLDTAASVIYGPKTPAGAWPIPGTSIIGPPGPAGGTFADAASDGHTYGRLNGSWTQVLPIAGGTLTGNLSLISGGVFSTLSKGSQYGTAGGTIATGNVAVADANVLMYNFTATNWCGYGCDTNGSWWLRVGNGSTAVPPALYFDAATQIGHFSNSPVAPTPTAGDNSTKVATTAFVAGQAGFLSGTAMLFMQATAPTGWTRVTTFDDALLRIIASGSPSSGGANGFVASYNGVTTVGNFTATLATTVAHQHTLPGGDSGPIGSNNSPQSIYVVQSNGSPNSSSTAYAGSSGAHNHTIARNIKYVDSIVATKN